MTDNLPLNITLTHSLFCTACQWGTVQNTPYQGENETFQGPLTSPPEILGITAVLFSIDVYLNLVQDGKFTLLNGPQTHTGLHEYSLMTH